MPDEGTPASGGSAGDQPPSVGGDRDKPPTSTRRRSPLPQFDQSPRKMKTYTVSRTELWALAASGFVGSTAIAFAVYFYKLWSDLGNKTPAPDAEIMGALYAVLIALVVVAVMGYAIFVVIVFRIKREHDESFWASLFP